MECPQRPRSGVLLGKQGGARQERGWTQVQLTGEFWEKEGLC